MSIDDAKRAYVFLVAATSFPSHFSAAELGQCMSGVAASEFGELIVFDEPLRLEHMLDEGEDECVLTAVGLDKWVATDKAQRCRDALRSNLLLLV